MRSSKSPSSIPKKNCYFPNDINTLAETWGLVWAYLVQGHYFDNPSFQVIYLFVSETHAIFLFSESGKSASQVGGLTYVDGCPMHDVSLETFVNFLHHAIRNRLPES